MEKRQSFGMLVVGGVIALGSIGVALFTAQVQTKPELETSKIVVDYGSVNSAWNDQRVDTDGDGLPDWKESLLGTDKNNPDTDGDGTSDGEEVAMHANPLKVGTDPVSDGGYKAPTSLTSTEALARELFVGYANGKKDGSLTKEETDKAIAEALQNRSQETPDFKVYTISDLSLGSFDAGIYETKLTKILGESATVREYELTVFARALNQSSSSEFEKLKSISLVYASIRDKLLQMEVPKEVATQHVALINSLGQISWSVNNLSNWSGDPLDALALVDRFIDSENAVGESIDALFTLTNLLDKQS